MCPWYFQAETVLRRAAVATKATVESFVMGKLYLNY